MLQLLDDHFCKGRAVHESDRFRIVGVAEEFDDRPQLGESFQSGPVVGGAFEGFLKGVERLLSLPTHRIHHPEVVPNGPDFRGLRGGLDKEADGVFFTTFEAGDRPAVEEGESGARMDGFKLIKRLSRFGGLGILDSLGEWIKGWSGLGKRRPRFLECGAHRFDRGEEMLDLEGILIGNGGVNRCGPRNQMREAKEVEFPRSGFDPAKWIR